MINGKGNFTRRIFRTAAETYISLDTRQKRLLGSFATKNGASTLKSPTDGPKCEVYLNKGEFIAVTEWVLGRTKVE